MIHAQCIVMRSLVLFFFMIIIGCQSMSADNEPMLSKLDSSLKQKEYYEQQKLERIDKLRKKLFEKRSNLSEYYSLSMALYDEYKSYKYDSAYFYANRSLYVSVKMNNIDSIIHSHCAVVFCLLSAGLYKEAFEEVNKIDIATSSRESHKDYYYTLSRLYYDLLDYNHAEPYQQYYLKKGSEYTDSLFRYLGHNVKDSLYAIGLKQMKEFQYDASVYSFRTLLKRNDIDLHTRAIVTSCLGWIHIALKDEEQAINYLAQAAIYDNESVTKETTALCTLASLVYKKGNIQRATEYVRLSMADANFYDARQRIIQTGQILPIIEQDRFNIMKGQRNAFIVVAIIAVLFIVALLVFTFIIRRQMKRLQEARQAIERTNHSLNMVIEQLRETNEIKDEYVGRSFYVNGEYVAKIEKLFKTIDRKIAARQFEDLRSSLKESTLNTERQNMYTVFDETFLKLFPRFVDKYNALFEEKDRKTPDEGSLTTEMRIFALIRLGVTDAEKIATFLNYSVHTINTYKTRVKNKSIVENEAFEKRIMEI